MGSIVGRLTTRILVGLSLLGVVYAAPVWAERRSDKDVNWSLRCQSLRDQFDVAWPSHQGFPRAMNGMDLRNRGVSLCQAGSYRAGAHDLKRALMTVGIKPVHAVQTTAQVTR
jgi:hypothetical protein